MGGVKYVNKLIFLHNNGRLDVYLHKLSGEMAEIVDFVFDERLFRATGNSYLAMVKE